MSPEPQFEAPPVGGNEPAWPQEAPFVPIAAPQPAAHPQPPAAPPAAATRTAPQSLPPPSMGWIPPAPRPSAVVGVFKRANQWIGSVIQRFTLPEDAGPPDPFGKLVASTPPWLISLIVHFSIMIFLGLAVLGAHTVIVHERQIEMDLTQKPEKKEIYAESLGEQLDDPSVKMSSEGLEPSKDAVAAIASSDLPKVANPLIGPPVLAPSPHGTMPVGTINTPAIGLEFSGARRA